MTQELEAGKQLAVLRATVTELSFHTGREFAETRNRMDPVGLLRATVAIINPSDRLMLRNDPSSAEVKELLLGEPDQRFFFRERKPGSGFRLTEVEKSDTGWHRRTAESGLEADLGQFLPVEPSLSALGLNLKITGETDPDPILAAHDRISLEVELTADNAKGVRVVEIGAGAAALHILGDSVRPNSVKIIRLPKTPGQLPLTLDTLVDQINKDTVLKGKLGIETIVRSTWASGDRAVSIGVAGERPTDLPYTFGMDLGDAVQASGFLPPKHSLRLLVLRSSGKAEPVLLGVGADGQCRFGSESKALRLLPGDAITLIPELYRSKEPIPAGALRRRLVSLGLQESKPGDTSVANPVVWISQGPADPKSIPFVDGLTLSDAMAATLPLATRAEKDMFRPVWLRPARSKSRPILFAASIENGCFFGHGAPARDVQLLPGDRIQIMPGKYDPDKDRRTATPL